jgi:hypothetical protein
VFLPVISYTYSYIIGALLSKLLSASVGKTHTKEKKETGRKAILRNSKNQQLGKF